MKLHSIVLLVTLFLMAVIMLSANVLARKKYYKTDQQNTSWFYGKDGAIDIL